jgi:hypothetical protein
VRERRGRAEETDRKVKGWEWTGTIEQVGMQVIQVLS